jgi:hypothetical protein
MNAMRLSRITIRLFLTAQLALALSACGASLPRVQAQGKVHGQAVDTTVDSRLAKYYLENYLAGDRSHPEWDARLDALHREHGSAPLTAAQLNTVSREYSVDIAALFYAMQLLENPKNRELQGRFEQQLQVLQNQADGTDGVPAHKYRVVFVPGWLYKSKPWTGADFAKPREILDQLGIEHYFIQLTNNGPVEDNARMLAEDLLPLLQDDTPVIIVSGSKGGPEVAVALGQLLTSQQTRPVKAWLNICGALQGSPLADKWTSWPAAWITNFLFQARGYGGLEGLESLRVERSEKRASQISLPDHILVVNYVGVPVSGTILDTEFEKRFTYVQLRDHGPNDGLVLIPDEIDGKGLTVTEVGRGHFLSYPDFALRTTALLQAVIQQLEGTATSAVATEKPRMDPVRPPATLEGTGESPALGAAVKPGSAMQ